MAQPAQVAKRRNLNSPARKCWDRNDRRRESAGRHSERINEHATAPNPTERSLARRVDSLDIRCATPPATLWHAACRGLEHRRWLTGYSQTAPGNAPDPQPVSVL